MILGMNMMIIGLTGKSGSGKNFAAEYMKTLGWKVLDLDAQCHECYQTARSEILGEFGTVDRREIGKIVFENAEKLRKLENILYPILRKRIEAEVKKILNENNAGVLVLNGALLRRAELDQICDKIIYVDAPYDVRLNRVIARDGISEEMFLKREMSQNDVSVFDVSYAAPVIIVDNTTNCTKQLVEVCKDIQPNSEV